MKLLIVTLMTTIVLTGCTWLNPYHENFMCKDADPGTCTSVKDAYKGSFNPSEAFSPMVKNDTKEDSAAKKENAEEYSYKQALYKELSGLIKNPSTPMLIPSRQMRVLVPGYVDKENLYYGHRYIYFVARDAKWALPVTSDMEEEER